MIQWCVSKGACLAHVSSGAQVYNGLAGLGRVCATERCRVMLCVVIPSRFNESMGRGVGGAAASGRGRWMNQYHSIEGEMIATGSIDQCAVSQSSHAPVPRPS